MRAFIALQISDEMKCELSRIQQELKKVSDGISWTGEDSMHLTLKFLGDINDEQVLEIKEILDGISSVTSPFETSLFKVGAFPDLNRIRVLWVGMDKACAEIEKIAAALEEELGKIGFFKEDRPFSAHLTLGRVRSAKNKEKLKEIVSSVEVAPNACLIDHITLYQSTLTPKGPVYSPLHVSAFKKS